MPLLFLNIEEEEAWVAGLDMHVIYSTAMCCALTMCHIPCWC